MSLGLCPQIRRLWSINSVLTRSARNVSRKVVKSVDDFENKSEKDLSKVKVYLKDEKDNILGIKSLNESKILAQKHHLNLIEDKAESSKHKYRVFRMVSNVFLAKMDAEVDETKTNLKDKTDKTAHKEPKHLVFSTKLSDNDLMTKIKITKRWLSRGHQIAIHVTNPKNDIQIVENFYNKFESELKRFAKFNQKKIKSDKSLKFVVIPNPDIKEQLKADGFEDNQSDDIDVENLDPNELLSDEFEKQIEEELEKK